MGEPIRVLSLVLAVLAGVVAGLIILAFSYAYVPNDLERVSTLLRALDANEDQVEVVVFGSSIAMGGVDAGQFPVPAYNLGTTGQTLAQARLLIQELPPTVNTIILVLEAMSLEMNQGNFMVPDVYNAYWMNGLRIEDVTRNDLEEIFPDAAPRIFSMSSFDQLLHSRWNLMQAINRGGRGLVTDNLELERAATDLFYPYTYTKSITPEKMHVAVNRYASLIRDDTFEVSSSNEAIIRQIASYARERSIHLIAAMPPSHPGVQEATGDQYRVQVVEKLTKIVEEEGGQFVDGTQVFYDEKYFIDAAHFGHDGAMLFTRRLVDAWQEH
jgi:hypothetical protein